MHETWRGEENRPEESGHSSFHSSLPGPKVSGLCLQSRLLTFRLRRGEGGPVGRTLNLSPPGP